MNLFLDTSVLIKIYHQEVGSQNLSNSLYRHADKFIVRANLCYRPFDLI